MGPDVNIASIRQFINLKKGLVLMRRGVSPETVCSVSSLVWRCYKARMAVGLVLTVLLCYLYRGQPATPRPALSQPRWTWRCDPVARVCLKTARNTSTAVVLSQAGCSLRCSPENFLWPLPSHYSVGEKVRVFSPSDTRRDIKAPSHQVEQLHCCHIRCLNAMPASLLE